MMRKSVKYTLIGLGLVLVCAAVAGFVYLRPTETPVQVQTVEVAKGEVTKLVTATGTVQPITQVTVGTQVSGVVEKIYVDYNSMVKKGQLLAQLDKANLNATLLQAKAQYDNAVNEQQYMQVVYDRQKQLYDSKFLSQADYDLALYNLNNAKSTVTQRLSDLQRAQQNLSYATIYSPIDGVVLSKDVEDGQTVAASYNTPTLFTIAQDLSQMQVEADVDEADIGQVTEGLRVSFTVDAFPDDEFAGTVTQVRLNPTTTSNVVTYTVVIKADNPDMKLKPGMTATISIYTLELKDELTLPAKALNFTPDFDLLTQYYQQNNLQAPTPPAPPKGSNKPGTMPKPGNLIWKLDGKEIKPVPVELGERDGVNVQVVTGLNEGDKIVYSLSGESTTATTTTAPSGASSGSPFMPKPPGSKR